MNKIQARWYSPYSGKRKPKLIVLHDMEIANKPQTAAMIGHYFQDMPATNKASAHVGVDQGEAVRYVDDNDIAYGAPGANATGLHMELAGYARFLAGEWSTQDMNSMLAIAAPIVRNWADTYGIPKVFVPAAELTSGASGITTHFEVSNAWHLTDHTDPGLHFPMANFLAAVNGAAPTTLQEASTMIGNQAVEILPTASGNGYTIVSSDGGVYCFGDAQFKGSMAGQPLAAPISGAALHPSGNGYWLLGEDGGVFAFGDAPFLGTATAYLQ